MVRPLLVRETRIPRTALYVLQKQLGVLGVAMVALLFLSTLILTTAFVMYPPRPALASPELPRSRMVAPPDQGIWVRATRPTATLPSAGCVR